MAATPQMDNSRDSAARAISSITRRYWIVWAAYAFAPSFIFAVYPLFLRSRGLNQLQINLVPVSYLLVMFLTDVPTGAFADAVGRRAAVVIGCAFHVAGFALYFFSYQYWHFIVAEILEGFGTTFGNGPIDAWAVDALDAAGFVGAKDRIFSRQFQLLRIVSMTGGLAGAYISRTSLAAPFLIGTFLWIVAGGVAFALMSGSPPRVRRETRIAEEIRRRTIDSTRIGFANRNVRLISLAGFITSSVWAAWWLEWQHYFDHGFGVGIQVVGWVFVGISVAQMLGAEVAARMSWAWERRAGFIASMSAVASLALVVAGLAGNAIWIALAAIVIAHLVSGAIGPMYQAWYNEMIEGNNRATLLSFGTTMSTLGAAIGQPVQGRMVDVFGTGVTWQLAGLVSLTQTACYLALGRRRKGDA